MALPAPRFTPARKRAVGIVRVSEVGDRGGESFTSPRDQRDIIERTCVQQGFRLVAVYEELDISAYSRIKLERRPGLGPAVGMIEHGEADVIVSPYFDRLFRNIKFQIETLQRIEQAGGAVLASDFGEVRTDTASRWLTSTMLGMFAEYLARLTAEKTQEAKIKAIAAGIPTFDHIPLGYRKDPATRRLVVHEAEAELVRAAFAMRETGASLEAIRDFLRANGARHGIRGVQHLLQQRIYLGELHFGKLINLHSHPPIVDPGLFRAVQKMRVARGARVTRSTRLLARLGIVRCVTCDKAMVVGGQVRTGRHYADYRCSNMGDCTQRVTISADLLEEAVVRFVKEADAEGHASADEQLDLAERAYRQAEESLSNVVSLLDGLGDLKATQDKLGELRAKRDDTYEHWQSLRAVRGTAGVRASNWDDLSLHEQRALLRATIKRITVRRALRGASVLNRISVETFAQ